jgi:chorismate dehydratase
VSSFRLGCVKYLNARPLIHGWPGEVVLDDPATLCAQLARGDLDIALVSSFEFLRNPIYRIVDDISISSDGPVYSVIVAHRGEISDVQEIASDPASQTSAALLQCLLAEPHRPRGVRLDPAAHDAQLLIGDQAIRFRRDYPEFRFWDLGEEWKRLVDLPFVYALWLIRPEFGDAKSISDRLRALRDDNVAKIDNLIAEEKEFDPAFCRRYFTEHLRFTFRKEEKEGLRRFQRLCAKHELLPEREVSLELV